MYSVVDLMDPIITSSPFHQFLGLPPDIILMRFQWAGSELI